MAPQDSYSIRVFIGDLIALVKPYKGQFFAGVFFRLTSDIARLYPAYALSLIIPLLGILHRNDSALQTVIVLLAIWIMVMLYEGFGHEVAKYQGYQVAEKAGYDLYKKCLSHIFRLDFAWHELEGSGNKMKKIDRGYEGVNQTVRRVFDVLIEVVVNVVGVSIIFLSFDKTLSILIIGFIITYFILGRFLLKKAIAQEHVVNPRVEELSGLTFESLNNILTIKSLSFNAGIFKVVTTHIKDLLEQIRKRIFYYRFQSGVLAVYFYLFEFLVMCYIIWQIYNGTATVGLLILFTWLFDKVGTSTDELIRVTQEIIVNKIWVGRAVGILRITPTIENPENSGQSLSYPSDWQKLRFKNLNFTYKKGKALTNVTFEIQRGESVGIVGLSGAGKSTLFKLILDLYRDYGGDIYLDEVPLKKIDRQEYINHVSVVLQDTELFNMTLEENISIVSNEKKKREVLLEVVEQAHLSDVVKNLSNGLATMVGEKGIKLSGGQRQRVGIARALYRQPDILLMDEATSHLDAYSEKQIQLAIADLQHKFTTIVIAHRLSTIKQMDKIIVLEKGKIKEMGSFDELIKLGGSFAAMWQMQRL